MSVRAIGSGWAPCRFCQVPPLTRRVTLRAGSTVRPADKLRLLLVDDDPPVRRSIARLLAEHFVVDQAGSGGEALSLLAGVLYDAIVCDVVMPAMNGLELYERVRVAQPQLAGRFVFVTGGVPSPELATRIEQTRCPVLQKPFGPGRLVSELDRLMSAQGSG